MVKQYGPKKGESVFYASANKGTITGIEKQEMANENRLRVARMKPRGGNGASNR